MTRRGTGNRQKKIVAPRGARGGEKRVVVTLPRRPPAERRGSAPQSTPRSGREDDSSRE